MTDHVFIPGNFVRWRKYKGGNTMENNSL